MLLYLEVKSHKCNYHYLLYFYVRQFIRPTSLFQFNELYCLLTNSSDQSAS
jgi:hypothetical protein